MAETKLLMALDEHPTHGGLEPCCIQRRPSAKPNHDRLIINVVSENSGTIAEALVFEVPVSVGELRLAWWQNGRELNFRLVTPQSDKEYYPERLIGN